MSTVSYRAELGRIGVAETDNIAYAGFVSRPDSLRGAMTAMSAPVSTDWSALKDIAHLDEKWNDEVQGLGMLAGHWIFSSNANQDKPWTRDKALYAFPAGKSLKSWSTALAYKDVPAPVGGTKESDSHWGPVTVHADKVWVAHWWAGGPKQGLASVVRFGFDGASFWLEDWIELERPLRDGVPTKTEFLGFAPWDGRMYSSYGDGTIDRLFLHESGGQLARDADGTPVSLTLGRSLSSIQGLCTSANGHVYISTNLHEIPKHQSIYSFSALNGCQHAVVNVLALESSQELEGICLADADVTDGHAILHAILLDNATVECDDVYWKAFTCSRFDLV